MKKIVVGAIAVAAAFTVLLVILFIKPSAETKREQHVIRVVLWSYEENSYDRRIIETFEEENPDIRVEVISYNSLYYQDNVNILMESGQRIDVLYVNQLPMLRTLIEHDFPLALDDLIERDEIDLTHYIAPEALRHPETGALLGLPYRKDRFLLYYNKDLFNMAGEPYPEDGMTWQEFYELGGRLKKKLDMVYTDRYGVFLFKTPSDQMAYTLKDPFDVLKDSFELLRPGLQMYRDLQDRGISTNLAEMDNLEGLQRMFNQGKYAMFVNGVWQLNMLADDMENDLVGFQWGAVDLPCWERGQPNRVQIAQSPLCINKDTQETEAAWRFVKYVCGTGGASILADELILPGYSSPEVDAVFAARAEEYGVPPDLCLNRFDCVVLPPTQKQAVLSQKIYTQYERALLGLDTVDESIAAMEQIRQNYLEKMTFNN